MPSMSIAQNLVQVRERINAAARRAGRRSEDIALMAVSKMFPAECIREAYDAGLRLFGESRVQELGGKIDSLSDLPAVEWHLIGHLQTNKAAKAVELFASVDSVDSLRLAQKLDASARQVSKKIGVLIEINIGGEAAKSGLAPGSRELEELLLGAHGLEYLEFRGLMAVPPFTDDPQEARPYFRRLRELRDQITARRLSGVDVGILSIGMSHDFEVAIEEGSNCVRVGTAIFGERSRK
jgi:pyridoxal phosphate enzyme (YggS family)